MVTKNSITTRIRRRMQALGIPSVKELERRCGFISPRTGKPTNMISDLFEGKKQSMRADDLTHVASILGTNVDWLIKGVGPETSTLVTEAYSINANLVGAPRQTDNFEIAHVVGSDKVNIAILRLDIISGECAFRRTMDSAFEIQRGIIVDPELFVADNIYASSMCAHKEISVLSKLVRLKDGSEVSFILDSGK